MKRKRLLLIIACVFLLGCGKKELSKEQLSEEVPVEKTEESVIQPEEQTQKVETEVSEKEEAIQPKTEHQEEEKKQEVNNNNFNTDASPPRKNLRSKVSRI